MTASLEHVKRGAIVACPMCGKERYRAKCHLRKKCCDECFARYRWYVSLANLRPLIESWRGIQEAGGWLPVSDVSALPPPFRKRSAPLGTGGII
jgi:hypothetical protein